MEWIEILSATLQASLHALSLYGNEGEVLIPETLEKEDVVEIGESNGQMSALWYRQAYLKEELFTQLFPGCTNAEYCVLVRELWFRPEYLPDTVKSEELAVVLQSHSDKAVSAITFELQARNCGLEVYRDGSWELVSFNSQDKGIVLPGLQSEESLPHRVVAYDVNDFIRHSLVIQLRQQVKK
jgi:hypothetical protein